MNLNLLQSAVLASVFVIVFNPKYEEKVIGENDYLVVDDKTDIWFKPEDLFIYGEWNGNKSVEQICYNIFGSEIAVKPKSESRGDNMNDNGKDSTNKTDVDLRNNVAAYKYQTITLPISKALYEKISNLSLISDTKFTFGEICDLLTMPPRLFDKEALIMFNVFKNLVNDRNLFLKLNQFFSENISMQEKAHLFNELNWYENAFVLFCENGYFILKDQLNNVIVTANDYEQQYKIPIYVESANNLFFPILVDYLAVDYRLLQNSCIDLSIFYYTKSGLTLDIDFTGFFTEKEEAKLCVNVVRNRIRSEHLNDFYELLNNPLLLLECVNKIILRISFVSYTFDFNFIMIKKIQLHCDNCIFSERICFPINLTALTISASAINTKLELPQRLDTLQIENCYINTEGSLLINENCTEITFYDVHGSINFPFNWSLQAIKFHELFARTNLKRNQDSSFEIFHISDVEIIDNIEIGHNIQTLYLENVQVDESITLKIHGSCKNIVLKNCAGCFDLTDFAKWLKLKFTKKRSSFNLTSEKERNTGNKSIKSIDFDVYMDKNTEFNVFGLIIPNDKLCSQIDNNQNMEGQYYISTPLKLLFLSYIKVISKFNPCYNFNLRLFIKEENSELTAKNINICRNVSINGIQKILLTRVRIADNQVVKITSEYNSLILEYCTGRFIVPGIQIGVKKYIDLQNTTFIQFYRIEEDIYSCKMTGINFGDKLLISHKIRIAQLENSELYEDVGLEFKYGCEILHLFDTKGVIISPDNSFKKIILSSYYQNFPVYYLSYPVYEIIISSCTINHQILIFIDSTKRIQLYSVKLTGHSMVVIDHECEKISIWKTTGRFVISNIMKTSPMRQAILNLRDGVFIFGSNFSKTQCSLLLEHVVIKRRTIVRENVHVLNLISVVIRRRAVLKINDDCEVLLIDSCKGNIDFSGCTNLRSLTIKNHKFIYHKGIYDNLLSLYLENVNINTTLRLGGNIKNVKLVGVTTRWFKLVQIDRNCEMVHVRNFVGSLNIPDLFIYSGKMFTRRMITIAYERMSDTFGGVMFFNDIYLKNDYEIPSNVESLILRNFKTNENARLKINESCKYLKLNVYQGYIDVSKMKSIKKVAFLNYLPIFGDNFWEFSDQCKYPINKIGKKKINLPNNIENVILERVNIPADHLLVVNENCQNVAIIFSEGNFDLSRIKKLESLKLLIEKQGLINIQFPDLSNVTTLEVSFDSNEEYFNLLLSKCINAKKLVLYNAVCELHDWIQNESSLGYKEEMTPYELSELKSIVEAESRAYQCRLSCELHRNFITHSKPIFDYNRQVIIRDLSIIAFSIDKECLKQLKRFFMLTRLSIVTRTIFAGLFDSLPFSLTDFSLMLIPCHVTVDLGISAAEDIDSKKKNTKNMNLVNLRLHGLFIVKMEQFLSFPDKVDVLEVMPLVMLSDKEIQVRKKMWVKKLIIMQMNSRTREIIRSDYALEEYFNHLLNVLSQYIDFGFIEEIKILDQDTEKLVDPRDYSTNR